MDVKAAQLRHFLNVARSRSFKEAARQSFRSQPAISLAIKTLENQIGAPLFESGKRVTLTGLGVAIVPLVEEFLQHHDRLSRAIERAATGQVGDISIAANPSVASRWLPIIIREYSKRHPDVSVYATDDNSEKVYDLVASGRVDLGLASFRRTSTDLKFTPIMSDHFGVLCLRDHPFSKRKKPMEWSLLRDVPIIGNITHRLLDQHAVYSYLSKPHIFMSTLTSLLANVEGGVGVTVLPQLASPDDHPRLVFRKLRSPEITRTIGILVRRGRTLQPHAQAMHDLIVSQFQRGKGSGS
jgi:DNA-binding transcriptional LysR family regulator